MLQNPLLSQPVQSSVQYLMNSSVKCFLPFHIYMKGPVWCIYCIFLCVFFHSFCQKYISNEKKYSTTFESVLLLRSTNDNFSKIPCVLLLGHELLLEWIRYAHSGRYGERNKNWSIFDIWYSSVCSIEETNFRFDRTPSARVMRGQRLVLIPF